MEEGRLTAARDKHCPEHVYMHVSVTVNTSRQGHVYQEQAGLSLSLPCPQASREGDAFSRQRVLWRESGNDDF
jgi:hypothetical protein